MIKYYSCAVDIFDENYNLQWTKKESKNELKINIEAKTEQKNQNDEEQENGLLPNYSIKMKSNWNKCYFVVSEILMSSVVLKMTLLIHKITYHFQLK